MKRIVFCCVLLSIFASCSLSPEKARERCLEDENNKVIYGELLKPYCDCVYGKLKIVADSVKLSKEIVDSVTIDCDAEFTNFDTNF